MRQFKLINSTGAEFNLMRLDAFFNSPDGLGFSMDNSYANIGTVYEITEEKSSQKAVTGEMIFKGYRQYKEFIKFISYKPLKLAYKPLDEWAYLKCTVTRLDKSEISSSTNLLTCAIDFTALSKWYIPRRAMTSDGDSTNIKKYTYRYGYTYVETASGEFRIINEGTEECPSILTLFGNCVNPNWVLSQNGKTLIKNGLNVEIPSNHKLIINSNDNEREIAEYTLDGTLYRNLYQKIDFDNKAFIVIPIGESMLRVTETSGNEVNAILEVEEVYETI